MEILNISVYLLVIFGCAIFNSDAEENRTLFNCEATVFSTKLNSTIKCVDRFYFSGEYEAKCVQYSNNVSMHIYWTSPLTETPHKLTCTSDAPLSNEIYFEGEVPSIDYDHVTIRHERVKSQLGSQTPEYVITFLVPDVKKGQFMFLDILAVKYKIFNTEDPESAVNVLFTYFNFDSAEVSPCPLYSLSTNFDILLNKEIITIPCLSMETQDTIHLFWRKDNQTAYAVIFIHSNDFPLINSLRKEKLKIDNRSLSYDPMEGFKLNTTLLTNSEGMYICSCYDHENEDSGRQPFTILRYTERLLYSIGKYETNVLHNQDIYVYNSEHNFDTITGSSKVSFDLECMNHLKNVTIEGEHTSTHFRRGHDPVESKTTQISEFPFNITIKHCKDGISSPYYFASAKVPYLNTSERTALNIVEQNYDHGFDRHKASLRCTDGNINLHNWNIYWVNGNPNGDRQVRPLSYNSKRFHCISDDEDLELRHIECETPTECRVFLKCFETMELNGEQNPWAMWDKEIVNIKGFSCKSQSKYVYYTAKDYCATTRSFKSGIVQCFSRNFNVLQPYFEGFDDQLYVTSEPPLSAIIKLSIHSTESDLYTKGQQKLLCEAHQFFYEYGIQWIFKNLNGTSISPDFLHHVPQNKSDYRYPKSTIEVSFAEVTEVVIVCLAPLLSKREWQNTTTILKLKKSLPPEFDNKDTDVYFDVNKKHQSITCHANGLPQPQIRWIRNNEVIEDESRIVDSVFKKVLLFPIYNESLSGEYICEASNIAGNKSLRFQVFTASVNGSLSLSNILIISGISSLMILLLLIFFVLYLRIEKVKRNRGMKDIIGLLNGNAESTDNPIELPFNTKLELEKHSFYLDKGMLLGKGEFGEVYKGRIEGFDGFIAFKTLSRNCSMSQIKALVSEIKMLMYVGDHPNLVELIGVYRKEIQEGILYMALEFCDLGSLESYLRTYKHLFMKCPIINSSLSIDIVERAGKEIGELPSIHSMKTLIKWCYQIANAMEYLGTKNVVHCDLAARNVLLTAEANAKVTDLGLSRRTYNYTEYIKKTKDALPWRWLAVECLLTNTFSSKSDVWAYGITLWEIFSFGEQPYPGMTHTLEFVEQLEKGLRNVKPKYASQELYYVMCECWLPDANKRPSFSALRIIFDSVLSRNETNMDLKISEDCNLEEIAKEISSAVYCHLEEK